MQLTTITDHTSLIYFHSRTKDSVISDFYIITDIYLRIDSYVLPDLYTFADICKCADIYILPDFSALLYKRGR